MALNLYRRHRVECEGGHPEDAKSGEFEERRKGWKRCNCSIHISGTLGVKFTRKHTGRTTWEEAKVVADAWAATGSWDSSSATPPPQPVPEPAEPGEDKLGITIMNATESFLDNRESRGVSVPTISKYKTFVKQLRAYCDSRGYVRLQQLSVTDMDRFYASWKDGKRSKAKKLERLKGFMKFCRKRKWLTENVVEDLEPPEGSSIPPEKSPFTDAELDRIYSACDAIGGPKPAGPGHREWSGEDVKDFILLSVYTGMRISDVATFEIKERLNGNDVFVRMHKTKKPLYTWIPNWLVDRLRARERKHGTLIFRLGESTEMRTMAELWRVKLNKVFRLAGEFPQRPTPHRFRYTFVRMLLEKGVPIADVAELIGDTDEVVRRHYAKWVPERQARLTKILQDALDDKPKPKLVAMPGGKRG